jgi:hypothetical protein
VDVGREASGPGGRGGGGGSCVAECRSGGSTSAHLAVCAGLHPPGVCRRVSFWGAHQRSLDYVMSEGVSTLAVVRSRGGEKHRTS